jgi:hypothetical protein
VTNADLLAKSRQEVDPAIANVEAAIVGNRYTSLQRLAQSGVENVSRMKEIWFN